jgi:hypothetical protein
MTTHAAQTTLQGRQIKHSNLILQMGGGSERLITGAFYKLDGSHENVSGIKETDCQFPTGPFTVYIYDLDC